MNSRTQEPRLGIDIGRVIIEPGGPGGADTNFIGGSDADAMATPPAPLALESITLLCERFDGLVWLVSKCGPRIQDRSRRWLKAQRFFEQTGVPGDQLRFCRERPQKALHARQLGLTHFIDDRLDVLTHLVPIVPHLYWFGHAASKRAPDWVTPVEDWIATTDAVLADLERGPIEPRALHA